MAKIFDLKDLRNKPSRNGFDLGNKNAFSAKIGELLPVYFKIAIPGDKFSLKHSHFTRTVPVQTAAFTRFREYFDWFFVPLRILWKSAPTALTMMSDNPIQAKSFWENIPVNTTMPYLKLSDLYGRGRDPLPTDSSAISRLVSRENFYGFNRAHTTAKLLNYLGYGYASDEYVDKVIAGTATDNCYFLDIPVNVFPLAAYQKIYSDYYRNSQWEDPQPFTWNFDYSSGGHLDFMSSSPESYWEDNTLFDLRYCNYTKDFFMGVLPDSQFGNVALVEGNLDGSGILGGQNVSVDFGFKSVRINGEHDAIVSPSSSNSDGLISNTEGIDMSNFREQPLMVKVGSRQIEIPNTDVSLTGVKSQFSILQLRQKEALQRWKEVSQSGNKDYAAQIYKHFGVKVPDALSNLCTWIGGTVTDLAINEVVNQALNGDEQAVIKGKGIGNGSGSESFDVKEHGIIMCIYHVVPLIDYSLSGVDLNLTQTEATDYPIPEFDKLGMQETPLIYLNNALYSASSPGLNPATTLGYSPRYVEYKTSIDKVNGIFRTSGYRDWNAAFDDVYLRDFFGNYDSVVNYNFFKVNPHLTDTIFPMEADSTVATDPFLVNAMFDVNVVRNLDYDGMPY